jgi:DNA repair protein RecN (Recombination protein N)
MDDMLVEIRVENFAIIDSLHISFKEGLTVITGETGAGKSIIIDAIQLLVGGRASTEFVRHGAEKAEIEALFDIELNAGCKNELAGVGIDSDDGMLVLRREVAKNGKSVCRANGKLITLSILRDIGQHLIDIHGQHEHQELLLSEKHLQLLDSFGDGELQKNKDLYLDHFKKAKDLAAKMERFSHDEQEIAQRLDLLQYQITEIEKAEIRLGEDEELQEERRKLMNFEKLYEAGQTAYEALNGEDKALDWMRKAISELESIDSLDAELDDVTKAIGESFYIIEEQTHLLRDHVELMEFDPNRLDAIEKRLDELNHLKHKYGKTTKDVLKHFEQIQIEHENLLSRDQRVEELEADFKKELAALSEKAKAMTSLRKVIATKLVDAINAQLADLYMEKARFEIGIEEQSTSGLQGFNKDGQDRVEFFISTNTGEPFKPLAKIASGGEMSRIMLAMKSHFKAYRGTTSIIFDEVDTGVGGRVAQAMAEKIYGLSKGSQVFCITHLPQVAAMADHHVYIAKNEKENRTITSVTSLNDAEKVEEIARMLSGVEMTELTRKHAEELIQLANEIKH